MQTIPKEAFSYWPSGEHVLIETKDLVERLIFSRQTYKPWELSALSQLDKLLTPCSLFSCVDSSEKLRFLYGTGWKLSHTASTIKDHLAWTQDWPHYKLIYPLVTQILISGGLYIHGRDHRYRPLIVLTPALLLDFPQHLLMAAGYFLLEYTKEQLLIPGQVENWVLLIDLSDCELKETYRKFISEFMQHFPCRLARAFVFHPQRAVAGMLKMLSPNLLQKLSLVEDKNQLLSVCNPTQLEERFGGTAKPPSSYWPPVFPSSAYRAESDPPEGLLSAYSSYEEYYGAPHKMCSEVSSLKLSRYDHESFISNSEFKDDAWNKLDIVTGSFSFLHTDLIAGLNEADNTEPVVKISAARHKSDDLTRTSLHVFKKISIEQELIEPSCCLDIACSII
jgi:hypothetical protein